MLSIPRVNELLMHIQRAYDEVMSSQEVIDNCFIRTSTLVTKVVEAASKFCDASREDLLEAWLCFALAEILDYKNAKAGAPN